MGGDPGMPAWIMSWGTEAGEGSTVIPLCPVIAQAMVMGWLLQVRGHNECGSSEQRGKAVLGVVRISQETLGLPNPRRPAAEIPTWWQVSPTPTRKIAWGTTLASSPHWAVQRQPNKECQP